MPESRTVEPMGVCRFLVLKVLRSEVVATLNFQVGIPTYARSHNYIRKSEQEKSSVCLADRCGTVVRDGAALMCTLAFFLGILAKGYKKGIT